VSSTADENPVFRVSGISYLRIPTLHPRESGAFYQAVFAWNLNGDPDDPHFEDGTGHVIGQWATDRQPSGDAGVVPYVFVARVHDTLAKVVANGGSVIRAPYPEGELWVATFRDPAGNEIGVWQQGPR
jgi:predicted enzyme related to lactoylglutathione lyase